MKRIKQTLLCLLCILGATDFAAAATVDIPTTAGTTIDMTNGTANGLKIEGAANIGSTGNGKSFQLTINNTVQQDYVLQFYSGAKNCTGNWSMTLTDGSSQEVWTATTLVPQSSTENWNRVTLHRFLVPNLPVGNYTFTLACTGNTGDYAGNIGELGFYTTDLVETLPCTLDLNKGTYITARVQNDGGNVGYVSNGASATYGFYCAEDGYFNLSMGVTYYGTGNIDITISNSATQEEEHTASFVPTADMTNYAVQPVLNAVRLSKGFHSMKFAFNTTSSYLLNYNNLTFTTASVEAASVTDLTVDGIALSSDIVSAINTADAYSATLTGNTYTETPTVKAQMSDASVISADVEVNGTTATSTFTSGAGASARTYTLNIDGIHLYNKTITDNTHTIAPSTGTTTDGTWSDGEVSLNGSGDWAFKLRSGNYTLNIPAYWRLKQVVFRNCSDNYASTGCVSAASSEGATVYTPTNTSLIQGTEKNITFNIDNHQTGQPFSFTLTDVSQATIKYIDFVYEEVEMTGAPQLLTTDITSTEHKNHCVVKMTFDRPIAMATSTVSGNACKVKGLGTSALSFSVWNLPYNSTSTLTIAAGNLQDNAGNKTTEDITQTIVVGSKVENIVTSFDYVVSNMTELKAALDAVKNNKKTDTRKYIYLKNGTYNANDMRTGDTEAEVKACQLKVGNNVSLIGESRDGVEIVYTPYAEGMGERTIELTYGCYAQDITFNTGIAIGAGRGVALYTSGDHIIINNCRALGGQDTYLTGGSCYWKGGVIQGNTDFIFGSGDYFFDGTQIDVLPGAHITAAAHSASTEWGYVFSNCSITPKGGTADGGYDLGRPWQGEPRVTYINTDMQVLPADAGWTKMSSLTTHLKEYASVHNGSDVSLASRACSSSTNQTKAADFQLTAAEAAEYTIINIFGENDGWLPTEEIPIIKAAQTIAAGDYITFSTDKAVAIPSGITAYYLAKAGDETALLNQIETGYIPANCGVVLKNASSEEKAMVFPVADVAVEAIAENLLVAGPTVAETGDYILAHPDGKPLGFYALNNGGDIPLGKAFLPKSNVTNSGAAQVPALRIIFSEETTGIEDTKANSAYVSSQYYNLQGQKISADYKGVVVVKGKKVTRKL